ncbi:MAG: WcaF family extracellular polysaccharide biosynthesis acetyltransferase [Flavobacteriales bacterium]|nr:WcaF family extracellular polysaccharide biosynthesis acetyltransferase [Flavobacteriales bacterium]
MNQTDLSQFNNEWYDPGSPLKRILWYIVSLIFFKSSFPFSVVKKSLLRLFGAQIGDGVVIKPSVNIKYPWKLVMGNHVWIGEGVWIDNLGAVKLGDHVCLSQGSFLLCGNHDYKSSKFDLIVKNIELEEGVWIGAKSIVCPGVTCKSHSVLSIGSVATTDLEAYSIYQGNPATKVRDRVIEK